jgi:stage III sporulation protein SpoIIIAA
MVGVTIRVGKTISGLVAMVADVLEDAAKRKASILLLGAPGMGKTSVIREMACKLAEDEWSVMIVDTSNEIAGDGDIPHPAIGGARRMQVPMASEQHKRMIEAVQNHTPDIIVVDEVRESAATACIAMLITIIMIS